MPEGCTWTIVRVAEEIPLPKQHEMRALFRWFSCFGLHIGCAHPVRGTYIAVCTGAHALLLGGGHARAFKWVIICVRGYIYA